jgi:hypothetical protein
LPVAIFWHRGPGAQMARLEFVSVRDAKPVGCTARSHDSCVWERCLEPLSEAVQAAQPAQFGWKDLRVGVLPALIPEPCQVIDLPLSGSSYLHSPRAHEAFCEVRIVTKLKNSGINSDRLAACTSQCTFRRRGCRCYDSYGFAKFVSLLLRWQRWILLKFWNCGIHFVPRLRVRNENVHLRLEPTWIIQGAG